MINHHVYMLIHVLCELHNQHPSYYYSLPIDDPASNYCIKNGWVNYKLSPDSDNNYILYITFAGLWEHHKQQLAKQKYMQESLKLATQKYMQESLKVLQVLDSVKTITNDYFR